MSSGVQTVDGALRTMKHNEMDRVLLVTDTVTINPEHTLVKIVTAGTYTITVPTAITLIAGVPYDIQYNVAAGGTVTVAFADGSTAPADITLEAQYDYVTFMRMGDCIRVISTSE